MPNGFKYLSKVNQYYCAAKDGEFVGTTITYVNQCGLTSTIVCPLPPSVSQNFYAYSFTINIAYNKSDITLVATDALVNQASSGSDFGMDDNTIKDDIIVYAINNRAYGPTDVTGYYAGIDDPPSSGYTVYSLRNCTPTYNVQVAENDATLIGIVNSYGASATTIHDALNWACQTPYISVVNKNYPNIYTNYLYFCIDPTFTISYPKGGSKVYSIASYPNWSGTTTTASESGSGWSWDSTVGGGSWTSNEDGGNWTCQTDFIGDEFTIDIWYRSIAQDSGKILFQTDLYGNTPNGVQIVVNTATELYVNLYENNNLISPVFSTSNLIENTFCNIVLTYNTTDGFRLYINNTLIGNVDNHKVDYTTNQFLYGGDNDQGQVKGYLSTLKVYYKDLSKISGALTQNYTNYQIT